MPGILWAIYIGGSGKKIIWQCATMMLGEDASTPADSSLLAIGERGEPVAAGSASCGKKIEGHRSKGVHPSIVSSAWPDGLSKPVFPMWVAHKDAWDCVPRGQTTHDEGVGRQIWHNLVLMAAVHWRRVPSWMRPAAQGQCSWVDAAAQTAQCREVPLTAAL